MAMASSSGYGGGSYSYTTVTETYTLEEAINKASTGSLSPSEVYPQMPGEIQGEVDRLARRLYSKAFSSLGYSEQRQVMAAFAAEIRRAKEEAEKPVSLFDALRLAAEGKIDDLKLYDALPQELRAPLDALAQGLNSPDFKRAKPEARSQVLKVVLAALVEQTTNNTAQEGLELHNRALELKQKGSSVEALKMMRDSEKALTQFVSSNPAPPAAVKAYCNLSSARAHIGDWANDTSALRSAITAADQGLAQLGKPAGQPDFNRGVLLHNRSHAGCRLGEISRDRPALIRGRKDVAEAGEVFLALKQADAVKENNDLSAKIENVIARL